MNPESAPVVIGSRPRPPWPLVPKLVFVSLLLGSFVSVEVLLRALPRESLEDWQRLIDAVGILFVTVIVPGSFLVVLFSVLLFWPQRRTFLRQRWAQVKVALLVLTLPALHLWARGVFTGLRAEVETGRLDGAADTLAFFRILVEVTIAVLLVALWIARVKPGARTVA